MNQKGQFLLFSRAEFKDWLLKQTIKRTISLIQNHHTWSPAYKDFNGSNHFTRLESMRSFHVNSRGFSDIAQNITTFPDGTIAVCRSLDVAPAGIKGANSNGICIEHFGNFDLGGDRMTEEHRKTILFINALLCFKFKLPLSTSAIVYHHWWDLNTGERKNGAGVTKTCPGTNFFGGNKVADAEAHFIPLVKKEYVQSFYPELQGNTGNKGGGKEGDTLEITQAQRTVLANALQNMFKQGVITDKSWIEKAEKGNLTLSELTWLNTIVLSRRP